MNKEEWERVKKLGPKQRLVWDSKRMGTYLKDQTKLIKELQRQQQKEEAKKL